MERPTWGIVATAREPTPVLLAFVAHYLHIGASEMHIYLDAPSPQFQDLIAQKPQVHVTVCDDAYWVDSVGQDRPPNNTVRQCINANRAYHRTECDWLLHADVDEFLIRHGAVLDFLGSRPDDILAVSIVAAERVFLRGRESGSVLNGVFRKPFPPGDMASVQAIYGDAGLYLTRGLSGHAANKTFYRVGAGLTLGLHQPKPRDTWRNSPQLQIFPRIGLLHFDSYTQEHWVQKMLFRVLDGKVRHGLNPGRAALVEKIYELQDEPTELSELYKAVRNLSGRQMILLAARLKLLPYRFSVEPALKAQWPGLRVDLSPESIDREMIHLNLAPVRNRGGQTQKASP